MSKVRKTLTKDIKHIEILIKPSNNSKIIGSDHSKWEVVDTSVEVLVPLITRNEKHSG